MESVKRIGPRTVVGAYKTQVADRRGKNVGTVAAARKQIEFVTTRCATTTSEPSTRPAAHAASPARGYRRRAAA